MDSINISVVCKECGSAIEFNLDGDLYGNLTISVPAFCDDCIKEHMEKQPYGCSCGDCGEDLNISRKRVHGDHSLSIQVEPCSCKEA